MRQSVLLILLLSGSLAGCQESVPVDEFAISAGRVPLEKTKRIGWDREWPGWRGPAGNGHVPDQPLLTTWSETENVVWRTDVPGRGHSSPVVIGDRIVLTTADEQRQEQKVLAFERNTGQLVWQTTVHTGQFAAAEDTHHKSTHANGTVATDGERVYAHFLNGGKIIATALRLDSGVQVWQREVGEFHSEFGFAPSPVMYHSYVVIGADNKRQGFLAALDGKTGEIAWRTPRKLENTFSTPAIIALAGRDQLLISGGQEVASYDPETGQLLWTSPGSASATCGTIVATDDLMFASGGFPQRETVCLDGTGELRWKNNGRLYEPSLLVVDDCLYGLNDDGIAFCWNTQDGAEHWKKRLSGGFSASPIVCNGLLYAPNLSGETYVFKATSAGYEEVAVNRLGDDCHACPAVHQSSLYLRIGVGQGSERKEQLVRLSASR